MSHPKGKVPPYIQPKKNEADYIVSLLKRATLGILTKDSSLKCRRAAKQMRAATSPIYQEHLIKNFF